jgi:hypothetical protein
MRPTRGVSSLSHSCKAPRSGHQLTGLSLRSAHPTRRGWMALYTAIDEQYTVLFRPYICHASRKGFESKLCTMTVTLLLSGRAKNKAKRVTFRLSGHASRAIYATNEAIGIFGHAWIANKGLVKLVTGEAKGHTPKGLKVRSKKYSILLLRAPDRAALKGCNRLKHLRQWLTGATVPLKGKQWAS